MTIASWCGTNDCRECDVCRLAEQVATLQAVEKETDFAAIVAALDLGMQAWRTVPSARDRITEAVRQVGNLRAALAATEDGPDPGSHGGHPYTPDERALGYGTPNDPRFRDASQDGAE